MPSWLPGFGLKYLIFGLKYLIPDASRSGNFHMLGSVKGDLTVFVDNWRFCLRKQQSFQRLTVAAKPLAGREIRPLG